MSVVSDDLVIAGGGLAAARTAQALRDLHHPGRIVLLSNESRLPYDRPPLSKRFLQGRATEEQVQLLTPQRFAELEIEVRLGHRVTGLDRSSRRVRLAGGDTVDYGRLVVATGARPIRLPTLDGFGNVHVLRSIEDACRLKEALKPGRRVGIVGAGFIGLEIAAVAVDSGCHVTVIEAAATPLAAILGVELGSCIQRWHERKGVVFRCGTKLLGPRGVGEVVGLELADGSSLPVDAVVVGVGQAPNVEWLADSGLELHRGLVCDEHGRTTDPHIFGVGDAVCCKAGQEYHPTRHWTAATEQARRVAGVIHGQPEQGPTVDDHYFWSDQHGSRLQFAGQVPANSRIVWLRGGPDEDRFIVLYCTAEYVAAVFGLGCPQEFLAHRMPLSRGELVAAPGK